MKKIIDGKTYNTGTAKEELITKAVENGAKHIERLDCMMIFNSDAEAAEQAEKDEIKIIHDMEFDDENSAAYIDTPENRKLLASLAV